MRVKVCIIVAGFFLATQLWSHPVSAMQASAAGQADKSVADKTAVRFHSIRATGANVAPHPHNAALRRIPHRHS